MRRGPRPIPSSTDLNELSRCFNRIVDLIEAPTDNQTQFTDRSLAVAGREASVVGQETQPAAVTDHSTLGGLDSPNAHPALAISASAHGDNPGITAQAALDWLTDNKQPLDATLTALAAMDGTTGAVTEIAPDVFAKRSIAVTAGHLTVANADGAAGNPTLGLPNSGVTAGTYGDTAQVPTVTFDAQGRATAASQEPAVNKLLSGYTVATVGPQLAATDSILSALEKLQYQVDGKVQGGTGLLVGGVISINAIDNTKFDISGLTAYFSEYSNPIVGTGKWVTITTQTGLTVTNIATQNATYIGINSSAAIIQQSTPFTFSQRRTIVSLGAVIHSNHTFINTVNSITNPIAWLLPQLDDLFIAIGPMNLNGNVYSAYDSDLRIKRTAGTIFKLGINFQADPTNPHSLLVAESNPDTHVRYRLQNGTESADTSFIDPNNYDVAGVKTLVPNNKFTVQRIYMFQSGLTRIQYGQTVYANLADAVSNYSSGPFNTEQNIADNGIFRGFLLLQQNSTDLSNVLKVLFFEAGKFGGASTSGGSGGGVTFATVTAALGYTPQPTDPDLTAIANLADAVGWLHNDGAGNFVYSVPTAGQVPFTPYGTVSSTFVQGAIQEHEDDLAALRQIGIDTHFTSGFVTRTDSAFTLNNSTRTLTISPTGSSFSVYQDEIKFNKTASSTIFDNVIGMHFIYFDTSANIQHSTTVWDILAGTITAAIVWWNGSAARISDERHGAGRNIPFHSYLHKTRGTAYQSGLTQIYPTSISSGILQIEEGYIDDEDIQFYIAQQKRCVIWYLTAAGVWNWVDGMDNGGYDRPYLWNAGTSSLQYVNSSTYALTDLANNKYMCVWVYATTDATPGDARPIYIVIPAIAAPYTSAANADGEIEPSVAGMVPELKLIYKWVFKGDGTFQTAYAKDFRTASSLPGGIQTTIAHNSTTNIQGGTTGERYHATAAEGAQVTALHANIMSRISLGF